MQDEKYVRYVKEWTEALDNGLITEEEFMHKMVDIVTQYLNETK